MFKPIKSKNGTTSFLPFDSKTRGKVKYIKNKGAICLTEDQTRYVHKKVEQGSNLNIETMKQEIEQEKLTEIKTNKENENPYQKVVLNNVDRDENKTTQMENWSILSDSVRYV